MNGYKISILILTDGESGRNIPHQKISSRKKQAIEACKILGIDKINFLDFPDQMTRGSPTTLAISIALPEITTAS